MAKLVRKEHTKSIRTEEEVDAPAVDPEVTEQTEKLKHEMDDLLDEIDSVLETNAADFVKEYIQKGGQ